MLPGAAESYWIETTDGTAYPQLTEDVEVDVAVVGGGIAGVCTAWELAAAGHRVALLEADRVVAGVTGYTTAKLSALHTLLYADLRRSLGDEAARLYARSQQRAVERVGAVAAELAIDCDLERVPGFTYAESADRVDDVRAEADAATAAGLPASFVTETGLPFPVAGAVRVEDQAQFHPRKYLLALVEDLVRRGGRVHERTRAVGLDEGQPCVVTTESGSRVTATDVVVATHYPVFDRALLFARLEPRRELVVAASITAERDPGGIYITTEQNTRSVRTAPYSDGRRLLIVTGQHFTPGTADVTSLFRELAEWLTARFPGAEITHRWAAQDNGTTDHVPYIGRFHPRAAHVWVATGFGGWGMSNGVLAGQLLASRIGGDEPPWTHLYDPIRLNPKHELAPMLKLQAQVARHFVGDRLRSSHVDSVHDIDPGEGAVMRVEGQRCAVYRDPDGVLHSLSATCTHLGCIVHFNEAETAWECPCHGSRFAVDGSVLNGPANRPLDPRPLPSE